MTVTSRAHEQFCSGQMSTGMVRSAEVTLRLLQAPFCCESHSPHLQCCCTNAEHCRVECKDVELQEHRITEGDNVETSHPCVLLSPELSAGYAHMVQCSTCIDSLLSDAHAHQPGGQKQARQSVSLSEAHIMPTCMSHTVQRRDHLQDLT